MNKILLGLGFVVLGIVGFLYPKIQPTDYSKITQLEQQVGDLSLKVSQNTDAFGAISIPSAPYLFQTTLSAAISSTGNSMALVKGTLKDGTSLTGYQCFTVDTSTAQAEYICGTASGTTITGLLRGINPLNPAATSTALAFSHRRGADVRISDFPILQVLKRLNDGTDSFPSRISLDSTIATSAFTTYNLVNKQYVDGVALQGSPTATTTTAGVVQIGTTAQIVAGTGMTGAYTLVPAGSLFNATSSSARIIPVTLASGKISQGFLDLTQAYTWTGLHIFNATTTLATTTVNGKDVFDNLGKFGGTGSDGALTITSGTTTIDCNLQTLCVKNYTSISITGTGALDFSNMATTTGGTAIILKSTGNVTITSSADAAIFARGGGGKGGAGDTVGGAAGARGFGGGGGAGANTVGSAGGAGVSTAGGAGTTGTSGSGFISTVGGTGGATTAGGAGGTIPWVFGTSTMPYLKMIPLIIGAGGGGGNSGVSASTGGDGGAGGSALYMEVGGLLNFTGTINAKGIDGVNGGTNSAGGGGGGGGGVIILYKNLTANSGTVTVTGGTGGTGGNSSGAGGNGGNGFSVIAKNTEF